MLVDVFGSHAFGVDSVARLMDSGVDVKIFSVIMVCCSVIIVCCSDIDRRFYLVDEVLVAFAGEPECCSDHVIA